MASLSDHVRRDAEHAARNFVSTSIGRVTRRWNETNKTKIKHNCEQGNIPTGVDEYEWGIAMGEVVASENAAEFFEEAALKAREKAKEAATRLAALEAGPSS